MTYLGSSFAVHRRLVTPPDHSALASPASCLRQLGGVSARTTALSSTGGEGFYTRLVAALILALAMAALRPPSMTQTVASYGMTQMF
jgi:hypothetical protein